LCAKSQNANWQFGPNKTFVFEIDNRQAEKLLRSKPEDSLALRFRTNFTDAFSEKWTNAPHQGHFIFADIYKNEVKYSYVPVIPFQVFLFKEYGALTLQVIDSAGNIRSDAKVRISKEWKLFNTYIPFDRASKTYTVDDWSENPERLLTVELDGFRAVFNLDKHLVNPYYGGGHTDDDTPDFYSYMITDKNKYSPHETVRFKSYALSGHRRAIKKELEVWLRTGREWNSFKKITNVKPYHPGGFAGEIFLHDSLDLKLDQHYTLQLRDKSGRIAASTLFRYEDYVLYGNELEVRLQNATQYYPDTGFLEIKMIDANGLILPDMRAQVAVFRKSIEKSYEDVLIVPDTVFLEDVALNNGDFTKVALPPDIYGNADGTFEISVLAFSPDYQRMEKREIIHFFKSHIRVGYSLRNDSIAFRLYVLGKEKNAEATLSYNRPGEKKTVQLPCEEPFNPTIEAYGFYVPEYDFKTSINVSDIRPDLQLEGGFTPDSFSVELKNPQRLDLSWFVYQGNILLEKGSGKDFSFSYASPDLSREHYVEIFYFLGGKEQVFRRIFSPKAEYLNIEVNFPPRIYPGQTVDASVEVRNQRNEPVKDVDLTAFAVNSRLGYSVPDLPYYGERPLKREQQSSYDISKAAFSVTYPLDFPFWNRLARLDTLPFYQFTFPRENIFTATVPAPDAITQVAPYVMYKGNAVNVYAIEINEKPVYFSWTEQPKAWSFAVEDGKPGSIALRLHDRRILLPPMYFEQGKKTILSIDLESAGKTAKSVLYFDKVYKSPRDKKDKGLYQFTAYEKNMFTPLISRVQVNMGDDFFFLTQKNAVYPVYLSCLNGSKQDIPVGPLPPGITRQMNGVEYLHEGGFYHRFAGNVIYKYPFEVIPSALWFSTDNKFNHLNDFCLNKTVLDSLVEKCRQERLVRRHPQNLIIHQDQFHLNLLLPEEKERSGVAGLLLINNKNSELYYRSSFPPSTYDLILLYNNGNYLRRNAVPVHQNVYTEVNMKNVPLHPGDSLSEEWLKLSMAAKDRFTVWPSETKTANLYTRDASLYGFGNKAVGYVLDGEGEPLIGASVMIKGTQYGTVTGMDGHFEMVLDRPSTLVFSYIGFMSQEIPVYPGSDISITMKENELYLEEVIVVGFGMQRKSSLTGAVAGISVSDNDAEMKYPEDKIEETETEKQAAENELYNDLLMLNGLRTNFSDVGFWKPDLFTDKKGRATFSATFPDNIARWDAVVYAMNRHLQTGTLRRSVQSFKPVMAELKTPQFLVAGDKSYFSGNIRNYTGDRSLEGEILFSVNADTLVRQDVQFDTSRQDYFPVEAAAADSLSAVYIFNRNDGYSDGEKRTIPVIPQGTEKADGVLRFLYNGDKIAVEPKENEEIHVRIDGRPVEIYLDAANYLTGYPYACNEQLASKLIGLLAYRMYEQFHGRKFRYDKNVTEIINRLLKNRNDEKMWSWWGRSSHTAYWLSAHVIRALKMAHDAGYTVDIQVNQDYMDARFFRPTSLNDIEPLHLLSELGIRQTYLPAIEMFENQIRKLEQTEDSIAHERLNYIKTSYLREKLLLWRIRQQQRLDFSPDSIVPYLQKDVLGAVYCDDGIDRPWYYDRHAVTLLAYEIVRQDSSLQHFMKPIQMYFLGAGYFRRNTYHAAFSLAVVFPDLLKEVQDKQASAHVLVSGKENRAIKEFPYEATVKPGEQLNIVKNEGAPLYYTAYTTKRVMEEEQGDAFEISTALSEEQLTAGIPVKLSVEVKVKQGSADYVMIEIPVPAACDYASKPQPNNNYWWRGSGEVHREYFRDKTVIFCETMPVGTYHFEIELLPRFSGAYTLNPAKVEMMYFPTVNANNGVKGIGVFERK
jgi:hypothetical protein